MTAVVEITIGQKHKVPTIEAVRKAFNFGGMSTMIKMARDPSRRPRVESYRDDAVWQALHCSERGQAQDKEAWWRIAEHVAVVLAATRTLHEARSRRVGR